MKKFIMIQLIILAFFTAIIISNEMKIDELRKENQRLLTEIHAEDIDLDPCPICGGKVRIVKLDRYSYIQCNKCNLKTDMYSYINDLVEYWNQQDQNRTEGDG